eukprot:2808-Prymnesium_polylepis.2
MDWSNSCDLQISCARPLYCMTRWGRDRGGSSRSRVRSGRSAHTRTHLAQLRRLQEVEENTSTAQTLVLVHVDTRHINADARHPIRHRDLPCPFQDVRDLLGVHRLHVDRASVHPDLSRRYAEDLPNLHASSKDGPRRLVVVVVHVGYPYTDCRSGVPQCGGTLREQHGESSVRDQLVLRRFRQDGDRVVPSDAVSSQEGRGLGHRRGSRRHIGALRGRVGPYFLPQSFAQLLGIGQECAMAFGNVKPPERAHKARPAVPLAETGEQR